MLVGNLVALAQHNIKRLMAYSSIGHVGIILAGVAALSPDSLLPANGVMLYLVGYSVTNMLVFAGLISFFNATGQEEIADFAGLAGRQPFLAATIAIGLFSLGGMPIFAGFTIKFYLFTAIASEGLLWLAGLAMFSSLISLYYYLQVIRQMYISPEPAVSSDGQDATAGAVPATLRLTPSATMLAVLAVTLLGVVLVGVYPAPLLDAINAASQAILPGS